MAESQTFKGWVAHDESSADGNMKWEAYAPKSFEETDVEIEISHCGVCGSDISHLRSGWKPADYPIVVGHEIVGRAARVGQRVKGITIGDRVGVGAQCKACLRPDCPMCSSDEEHHCQNEFVTTYDARFKDGSKAMGGYATCWRGPAEFVFQIPEGIRSEVAAPMLCGGLTVYSPLIENGAGPGKRVGIVGVGGLGHFAIMFAKALKSDKVVAISRTSSKKDDAHSMGADDFIATSEEPDWMTKHASSLDLIISTVSGAGLELEKYLALLDLKGTLIQVGAPEDPIPAFNAFALLKNNRKVGGSLIGSRKTCREMLELAAKENVQAWVNVRPMSEANEAVVDMANGKARYRYVLANK